MKAELCSEIRLNRNPEFQTFSWLFTQKIPRFLEKPDFTVMLLIYIFSLNVCECAKENILTCCWNKQESFHLFHKQNFTHLSLFSFSLHKFSFFLSLFAAIFIMKSKTIDKKTMKSKIKLLIITNYEKKI